MKPRGKDWYDPREEQVRAQRQGIYEQLVKKALRLPSSTPFRDARGRRLDIRGPGPALVSQAFAIGTAVPQKHARLMPGSQTPTVFAAAESHARYRDVDRLLRNRQDYEETLALARRSFYRVTTEPTQTGDARFIWPLPPKQTRPVRVPDRASDAEVQAVLAQLNETMDPRSTGVFWLPPRTEYTAGSLAHWLPPERFWTEG